MRIVTGSIFLLALAAHPVSASEAFIAQLTGRAVASERAAVTAKTALASTMLALPVQPNAIGSLAPAAGVAGSNTSTVMQSGTGNFAVVSQAGGGNTSSVTQRGSGNQAVVTQRQTGH
jgi:hypothetical protein